MKIKTHVMKTSTGYCDKYIVAADYLPYVAEISDPEAGNADTSIMIGGVGDYAEDSNRIYLSVDQWAPFVALVKKMDKILVKKT